MIQKDWSSHYGLVHLRENPFQELSGEQLCFLFPLPDRLIEILQQEPPWTLQILGPCGSGKTSTLVRIFHHFRVRGYEPLLFTVGREETELPMHVPLLLLDEAQLLKEHILLELLVSRHDRGVITVDAGAGDPSSRLPFISAVWTVPAPSPEDLQQIFFRRLQYFSIGDEVSTFSLTGSAAEEALRISHRNLRSARALLYEIFTWEPIPSRIELNHIKKAFDSLSFSASGYNH